MNATQSLRMTAAENLSRALLHTVGAISRLRDDHGHQYGKSTTLDTLQRINAELYTLRLSLEQQEQRPPCPCGKHGRTLHDGHACQA